MKKNESIKSLADLEQLAPVIPTDASTKVDAIVAVLLTETEQAAAFEAAKAEFVKFGEQAAQGDGVATRMAFRFCELRMAGTAKAGTAEALYAPYAEGYNAAKHGTSDALAKGSNSYASGLSQFATFGLDGAIAVQQEVGMLYEAHVMRLRDAMPEKSAAIGSNYACFVAVNRKLDGEFKSGGIGKLVATLANPETRDAWILDVIAKPDAAAKDDFALVRDAIKTVERAAKRADKAGTGRGADWLSAAKLLQDAHDTVLERVQRVAAENAAHSIGTLVKREDVTTH